MKALVVLCAFFIGSLCKDESCYTNALRVCSLVASKRNHSTSNCNARYGAIDVLQANLQQYANQLLYRSFDFLLMSTYFGNYVKNRPGFEKLYREYSDELWIDGMETIKYIDARGGSMNFCNIPRNMKKCTENSEDDWELSEYISLSIALEVEKELAEEIFKIHLKANNQASGSYDAEIAHYLEEKFVGKYRDAIRNLAGFTKDLEEMLNTEDATLAVYIFDKKLQS